MIFNIFLLFALSTSLFLAPPLWSQPVFVEKTREAGLLFYNTFGEEHKRCILGGHPGSGAAFFDYDGDGDLDLYVTNGATLETFADKSGPGNGLFRNQGDGTFQNVADEAGVDDAGWGAGVAVGDYDNDGWRDLYVTNYGPNVLYRNLGDGQFADVTAAAGVGGQDCSASAAFFDYDGDGDLDLYVVNYVVFDVAALPDDPARDEKCVYVAGLRVYCGPLGMVGAGDRLYRNDGDGRFADVTDATGIAAANDYYGLGVMPEDYDNDGDMDLFVINDETPNVLFRNDGGQRFVDVAPEVGVAYNADGEEESGMGVDAGDYDNDGDMDFYVTNFYRETNTLYRNDGAAGFADVTTLTGLGVPTLNWLGWSTRFFDYDNDADLDLFVVNGHVYPEVDLSEFTGTTYAQPNLLFANQGNGEFIDVSATSGPGLAVTKVSRGACFGDYDDDGDVDVFVVNLNDTPTLLRNDGGNGYNWLTVLALGTRDNRDGVGARVRVITSSGSQLRTVNGSSGYLAHNDIRAHFGLGQQLRADVEITWPDGAVQKIEDMPANRLLVVHQNGGHGVLGLGADPHAAE